jgi:type I restriction enzyme R subunit
MSNEDLTCRTYVVPQLHAASWNSAPHSIVEQYTFTDGRIIVAGSAARRKDGKRADYLLRYTTDSPIAVVEAKAEYKRPGDGLQQAKDYAAILDLKFAYATNGHGIIEFDFLTGVERELDAFPTPAELWARLQAGSGFAPELAQKLLTPAERLSGRPPRYYQEIAITRAITAILKSQDRLLLTLATGTGKTVVAFQICWKLWQMRWTRTGEYRRPKILFLADRAVLVDDPKDKTFAPFGEARIKVEGGDVPLSRDLYFATYQALAEDERRAGRYRAFPPDFFDLVIIDECHRGSASDESNWREILAYFHPAVHLGMTATPKRDDNVDTYSYFGEPLYTYSLRQGIEDGFLAPYRVQRVLTSADALGWRPSAGDRDRYGRAIPDSEYHTPNFERQVALRARTEAIARHLTDYLRATDRFAKTIVFCVDQDHALEMRRALTTLNADLVQRQPNYVVRITSDEGDIGRGLLDDFKDVDEATPVIVTTSQLLTTGVDIPTCKNVVLARVITALTEFKQIIGRGTRVREDYGKLSFTILDYTGSATQLFADPAFDGEPVRVIQQTIDDLGETVTEEVEAEASETEQERQDAIAEQGDVPYETGVIPRKFYFDGGRVEILAQVVYELDTDGTQLRVVSLTEYAGGRVRALVTSADELRDQWIDPARRAAVIRGLEERGVSVTDLASALGQPEADPFDLLCHVAFHAPLRTRRERADRVRRERSDLLSQYSTQARAVLDDLLEKYATHGMEQLSIPDALKVPPISRRGNIREIIGFFGSAEQLRAAVDELQRQLYAA